MIQSIHALKQGRLSPELVSPAMMRTIIAQISWPVLPRSANQYYLFNAQSVHMPVQNTDGFIRSKQQPDFTRITLPYSYIAVSSTDFVEIKTAELQSCAVMAGSYFCFQNFIELKHGKNTCLSSLYFNASLPVVSQLCDAEFYPSPYFPEPKLLDTDEQLIISGLKADWTFTCKQRHVPHRLIGSPYAVIDHRALCRCSIAASNGYIARRITNCDDSPPVHLKLGYVLNVLAFSNLVQHDSYNSSYFNRAVTNSPVEVDLPDLTSLKSLSVVKLANSTKGSIKLRQLSKELRAKTAIFESKWELINARFEFRNWWTSSGWPSAAVFICSIMGVIALVGVIYLTCKYNNSNNLLSSLMFASLFHKTSGHPMNGLDQSIQNALTVDLSAKSLTQITIFHILVIVLMAMLYRLIKIMYARYCCHQAEVLNTHPVMRKHPRARIYLEFYSGHQRVIIYVMTIKAHVSHLQYMGELLPDNVRIDNYPLYSVLRLDWNAGACQLTVDSIGIELPHLVQVPLHKRKRLTEVLAASCTCTLIAQDGLYLYKLTDSRKGALTQITKGPYSELIQELSYRASAPPSAAELTDSSGTSPGTSN